MAEPCGPGAAARLAAAGVSVEPPEEAPVQLWAPSPGVAARHGVLPAEEVAQPGEPPGAAAERRGARRVAGVGRHAAQRGVGAARHAVRLLEAAEAPRAVQLREEALDGRRAVAVPGARPEGVAARGGRRAADACCRQARGRPAPPRWTALRWTRTGPAPESARGGRRSWPSSSAGGSEWFSWNPVDEDNVEERQADVAP